MKSFKIGTKILLGFSAIIALAIFALGYDYLALSRATDTFTEYRTLARQTSADGRVQANMLSTRIFAKNFVIDKNQSNIDGVNGRAQATIEMIIEAESLTRDNPERTLLLEEMQNGLNRYVSQFLSVTELQARRDEIVQNQLNILGPQTEQNLTAIMNSALEDGDTQAAFQAGVVMRSLLLGRLYANRFLIQNDSASNARAVQEFKDMEIAQLDLDDQLEDPERQGLARLVRESQSAYLAAFNEVYQTITERNLIILHELDRIGPEVADRIERLKLSIQGQQDELGPVAEQDLSTALTVSLTTSIIAIILGMLAAGFIARSISLPLTRLTKAAVALENGENPKLDDLAGTTEVGILAKAFIDMRGSIDDRTEKLKAENLVRREAESQLTKALTEVEEASEAKAKYLTTILDSAPDPTILVDNHGVIVLVNEQTRKLFGYENSELLGEKVEILVPAHLRKPHVGLRDGFLTSPSVRSMGANIELTSIDKGGREFPVEVSLSPIDSDEENLVAASVRDVTVRTQLESELREAKNAAEEAATAKSVFLATMSHEIRTPMNGIIGMVDLLRQSNLSEEYRQMIQTISDSGQSLLTIINDILDFSKIEAGKLELESVDFSLLETLESSIDLLKPKAVDKGLDLITYVDPLIPQFILGDPVRVRQILINLAGNAIKFTDTGQVIVRADLVSKNEEDVRINFRVIDEGIGISEEGKGKLFQSFSQTESSTTRKYGGTGLGLSICQRLTEIMQSKIEVESELGKGSEFHFAVSFKKSDKSIQRDKVSDLSGLNIMLVTHSDIERFICQQYLERWLANVITVDDISEVIDKAESCLKEGNPLDIVVLCSDWPQDQQKSMREIFKQEESLKDINFVLLMKGSRTKPRLDNPETVQIDVGPMRRVTYLAAVSIAAGRASPEVYHEAQVENLNVRNAALSIEDALERNTLILVAEDNPTNRDVISRQLDMLGYTCEMANDGKEALQAWNTGRYFLLLTDCHMPEMDGYDLAGAVRKEEEAKSADRSPIIAITANALQGESEKCLAAGMDDYLSKPIDMKDFRKKLLHWMPHFNPQEDEDSEEIISTDSGISSNGPKDGRVKSAQDQTSAPDTSFDDNGLEADSCPIDDRILKDMFGDDEEVFKEILQSFIEPTEAIIADMKKSYKDRLAAEVQSHAHKLKSASRSIGANELADTSQALESAGSESNWKVIDALHPNLEPQFTKVKAFIDSL